MVAVITRLRTRLADQVSIQSLVFVRVAFGALLVWDCWRYIRDDRIERYYVDVDMTFPYFGLDFIRPLPEPYIHWVWILVGVSAFLVMVGLFYRLAIIVLTLTFGYFFLLDKAQYLNHHYMVLLYGILLALAPANRAFAVDAWLFPAQRSASIARWPVSALRLQTEIILIYAGIVKITDDWLRGEPLRMWMLESDVLISPIFQYDFVIMAAAIGTVALHILGAPLLLWRPTRLWIFLIYCVFHVSNSIFFNIGIFPWLTIAATTIFFDPDWPGRLVARVAPGLARRIPMRPQGAAGQAKLSRPLLAVLVAWFAVQIYLPERQAFFPNLVGWTGDGHRFSWRMRIYDRSADGWFVVVANDGTRWRIDPRDYLTARQEQSVLTRTDMIHEFARRLETLWGYAGHGDVAVHAHVMHALNGRPKQRFVDETVDLTEVDYNIFGPDAWVVPLASRAAEGKVADWWPPLPLQRR